jgi:hypothetical protein
MAQQITDKARWQQAAQQLFAATLAGAKAGEDAFPEMELDTVNVKWAAVPVFDQQGNAFADTKEPGTTPFITEATYKRKAASL